MVPDALVIGPALHSRLWYYEGRGRVPGEGERKRKTRKDKKRDSERLSIKLAFKYTSLTAWSSVLSQTFFQYDIIAIHFLFFSFSLFLILSFSPFSICPPVFGQLWVRIGLLVVLALPLWWQNHVCGLCLSVCLGAIAITPVNNLIRITIISYYSCWFIRPCISG